ncbi:MAG: type I 3-dehydroquinate dehydratase [Akkermansiaceae bacterium]
MSVTLFPFPSSNPSVVGSFGDLLALRSATPASLSLECDLAEIRLDLFHQEISQQGPQLWAHLNGFPLLFTARRHSEGSPFDLSVDNRKSLLELALPAATLIDIEVSSIAEMADLIANFNTQSIPWIASFHNFERLPTLDELIPRAAQAKQAGAAAFKFAARLNRVEELTTLVNLQTHDFGLPVASMGMGSLGAESRLLCAQNGSVLNYGFIGDTETAPGQWPAKLLRERIHALGKIST